MPEYDFDLAVIGGGSGGFAAARTGTAAGLKTVLVEGGRELGGLCILRGCMPTKALLWAAELRHLTQRAAIWGLEPGANRFNWTAVQARKAEMIRDFAGYREGQLTAGRFTLRRATARFTDSHTLALSDGGTIRARHFVVATGSVVSPPPLPEIAAVGYITSDEVIALEDLPRSIIVLGGGVVAVELAQLLARFGVEVTLVQRSEHLLRDFDTDAAAVVEQVFRREGIRVFTNTRLTSARREGGQKVVSFEHAGTSTEVRAEQILLALGRSPNTSGLGLEQAGVACAAGRIITDAHMRTSAPHIYAAGDCTGPYEVVHLAIQQGEIAVHNLRRTDAARAMDYRLLLGVVFTDPQVAVVGLTEKAARAERLPFEAASYPFNDHGKSLIMEAKDGFVKLLADPRTGEILGGACAGPAAGELIHEVAVAMAARMTVRSFAAVPHYHPTLAEIWTYPAEELADRCRG